MGSQIESAKRVLERFLTEKREGPYSIVDREQVVAHALLSGWVAHWPSEADQRTRTLLLDTQEIKAAEHSRWMVQRRIAIAKLAKSREAPIFS